MLPLPLSEENAAKLEYELRSPGADRLLYTADAFRAGWPIERVYELTRIDPWFLAQIEDLINEEARLRAAGASGLDAARLRALKRKGFSDSRLARLTAQSEERLRQRRQSGAYGRSIRESIPAQRSSRRSTAYMYSTYEEECEAAPTQRRKIMILGGGPNRIGQGSSSTTAACTPRLRLR